LFYYKCFCGSFWREEEVIGEWIEFEDMILEVVSETEYSYYCRIVDYMKMTYKLKYGGYITVAKEVCV
jgi:hypothetical protein